MRRLLPIGLGLALLLSGWVVVSPVQAGRAGKAGCAKIRHSKTVWVKVKRHGKIVRVRRRRVWWTCDPYEAPGPPRLAVVAKEFKLTFSRPYVKAGKLILEFDNEGGDVHNLRIGRRSGGPAFARVGNTAPRRHARVRIPLKQGSYRLWCALPGHAKLGMKAVLRVRPKRPAR